MGFRCVAKKRIVFWVTLGITMFLLVLSAIMYVDAETGAANSNGRVSVSLGAVVRGGPSTSSRRVRVVGNQTPMVIYSERFTSSSSTNPSTIWYETSLGGFIRSDLVSISYGAKDAKVLEYLNGRAGAGTDFPARYLFKPNQRVSVLAKAYDAQGGIWYKVQYGGGSYYVYGQYISFVGNIPAAPPGSVNQEKPVTPPYSAGNVSGNKTDANGKINAGAGAFVRRAATTLSSRVRLLVDNTILLIKSEKFTTASSNGKTDIWYETDKGGYVRSDLVSVSYGPGEAGVTTDALRVRSGAGTGFGTVSVLSKGSGVTIKLRAFDVSGNLWYKIAYGNTMMYVSGDYVRLNSPTTPAVSPKPSVPAKPSVPETPQKPLPTEPSVKPAPAKPTPTTKVASSATSKGRINADPGIPVRVRKGPSTATRILKNTYRNTSFTVLNEVFTTNHSIATSDIWLNTSLGGYVRSDLVDITHENFDGYTTEALNARKGAGISFDRVKTYPKGTKLKIVMKAEDTSGTIWYKVEDGRGYLYVIGTYISDAPPAHVVPKPQPEPSNPPATNEGNGSGAPVLSEDEFEAEMDAQGFPESYKTNLRAMHKQYPKWRFVAKHVGLDWNKAVDKQFASQNLVYSTHPEGYRDVDPESFDFVNGLYKPKDGNVFFKATRDSVKFYMDPRNALSTESVFMFEDTHYNPKFQTEDVVKDILKGTSMPSNASRYFMEAANQTYNGRRISVSPVFMASKVLNEIGPYTTMISGKAFRYGGRTYAGAYNPFNIGATDSPGGGAVEKGLYYALSGSSYLRPWTSLEKSIKGGAAFLYDGFMANNQYTGYTERFNVYNGLNAVGTHQYMTAIYGAYNNASTTYRNYLRAGTLNLPMVFEIPVFDGMPLDAEPQPAKGHNICYLKNLYVVANGKVVSMTKTFNQLAGDYEAQGDLPYDVASVLVKAIPYRDDVNVAINGDGNENIPLKDGANVITVVSTSPSGKTMTYRITLIRQGQRIMTRSIQPLDEDDSNEAKEVIETSKGTDIF